MKNKKAQEEMVGFALIIIIVAIIMLSFLFFYLRKSPAEKEVESYQVESFLQAVLQYTTDCAINYEPQYLDVRHLIGKCRDEPDSECTNGKETCLVLNQSFSNIMEKSWKIGETEETPVKGYSLKIMQENSTILEINKGNITYKYYGAPQDLAYETGVILKIYY